VGVAEGALRAVGLGSLFAPWLGLRSTALVTLALISVWQFVGTPLMLIYASLLNIPDELVDAARVDGLGRLRIFLRPLRRAKAAGGDWPAIVREPDVFLFDEPLSNLDAALRVSTRIETARPHRLLGATMVYVTHDQIEAMTPADRIVVMNHGRIEQVGKPLELYYSLADLFVAGFIGAPAMNFFPAEVESIEDGTARIAGDSVARPVLPAGPLKPGAAVSTGVRPEHLTPSAEGDFATLESWRLIASDGERRRQAGRQSALVPAFAPR
jgi:hypothetical protein